MSDQGRNEVEVTVMTDKGPLTLTATDRIVVDDVFLHLVRGEVARVIEGTNVDDEVDPTFVAFLLKERFSAGSL